MALALAPVAALALLVAVLVAGARDASPAGDSAGAAVPAGVTVEVAPAFAVADLRAPGGTVRFGSPTRPTVINFFGAWCGPCRQEMPLIAQTARARTDIDFVGLDVQDVRSDALAFLAETKADFPVGVDADRGVARAYRLRGMPTTLFIAPGGRVVAQHTGPITARDLRAMLDRLEAR